MKKREFHWIMTNKASKFESMNRLINPILNLSKRMTSKFPLLFSEEIYFELVKV